MSKTAIITFALLATIIGVGGYQVKVKNEEFRKKEHTLNVGDGIHCSRGSLDPFEHGFVYGGMPNEETFSVVPCAYKKGFSYYFPIDTKKMRDTVKVLEVTPEYLKIKCE